MFTARFERQNCSFLVESYQNMQKTPNFQVFDFFVQLIVLSLSCFLALNVFINSATKDSGIQ